ncbi:MAG: hypothetical protein JWN48_1379 [Myxococcaceae bacterium]|nr:hypothetical protein [Myxococcaceae bacterium]
MKPADFGQTPVLHAGSRFARGELAGIGAITVLALVLRSIRLDAPLWYDEILTLVRFVRLPLGQLLTTYSSLNNHVLYSLEAKLSILCLGEHPWSLRLPAMLFGVASVPLTWYVVQRRVGRAQALVVAALLALSYHHVWFSQNARGYTGLLFWTLLSVQIASQPDLRTSWRRQLAFAVAVALASFTHLSAALFFVGQGVLFVLPRSWGWPAELDATTSRLRWQPLKALALGALLTALLHAPMLPQLLKTYRAHVPLATPAAVQTATASRGLAEWKTVGWMVREVVRSFGDVGPLLSLALLLGTLCALLGVFGLWRKAPLLTASYALHVPLTLACLLLAGMRVWPRYFFIDLPFFVLCGVQGMFMVASAVERLWASSRSRPLRPGLLASLGGVAVVLASTVLLPANYRHPKQDFQGALDYLGSTRQPGDAVGVIGLANVPFRELYQQSFARVDSEAELQSLRAPAGATWLVYAFPSHTRSNYPALVQVMQREFQRMKELPGTLGDGSVLIYRSER